MSKWKEQREQIINMSINNTEKICMILGHNMDFGGDNGGMISVKKFDDVSNDLCYFISQIRQNDESSLLIKTHSELQSCGRELDEKISRIIREHYHNN